MRIGYDITAVSPQPSGVGTYALQLLLGMVDAEEHQFLLLSNQAGHQGHLGGRRGVQDAFRPFPSRMLWMQLALPQQLRGLRPELCHYPNSIAPLRSPCPYVVTIHDMSLSVLPKHHPWRRRLLVRPLIPLAARRAARIITVSTQARDDIVRLLRVPASRVAVIPEAAAPVFRPADGAEQARVRAAYGLRRPYMLYIGTLEPRKNLVRLIRAWHELRQRGAICQQLVVVGAPGWQFQPIFAEAARLGCADDLIFTGYLPLADLPAIYTAADCFAFPSLYEGFGLPVIEAMSCGTPTLISDTPALSELAGGAALRVSPHSVAAIAAGLEQLLGDGPLRERLRSAGLARAAEFSWQRTARETLGVYRQALGERCAPASDAQRVELAVEAPGQPGLRAEGRGRNG
jgi:glycosyltransferase involved in cell wall biosynthesis